MVTQVLFYFKAIALLLIQCTGFPYGCETLVGLGRTKGLIVKCVSDGAVCCPVTVKNSVHVGAEIKMMSYIIPT